MREAFRTGSSLFFDESSESEFFKSEIWKLAGRPAAVLFEPLFSGKEPIGVLVVAGPRRSASAGHGPL